MTSLDVGLKQRKAIIKIAKVLSRQNNGPAGFPAMVVEDTNGKQHALSYLDFAISLEEWGKIGPGSKLEVSIEEVIKRTTIV